MVLLLFTFSDDHGFSPLHWAAKEGRLIIGEMLINKGARINSTNMGDDTALHLASAHGHRDVVMLLLRNKVRSAQSISKSIPDEIYP